VAIDSTKFDVGLNDIGFLIKPGSYTKKPIQFFAQQRAEGEPSLADASIFKFFSQTDWLGGYDEEQLVAPNVFKDSNNIDINRKGGEIRLSRQFSGNRITNEADMVTTAANAVVTSANATFVTDEVQQGDKLRITSGSDKGEHIVQSVDSETQITLTANLTTSDTAIIYIVYQDHPIIPVTTTTEALDDSETEIDLTAITGIPTSGTGRIEGERITWTNISTLTLTGVTRGVGTTTAEAHDSGAVLELVDAITTQLVFNNLFVLAIGKFIFTSSDAATWVKRLTAGQNVTDACVSQGVLVVAAGTDGFHWSRNGTSFTGVQGDNQATASTFVITNDIGGTEELLISNGSTFSRAIYTTGGPGSWEVTTIKTLSVDETNFLLKPVHWRGNVYVWCNRGSETLGRSDLYVYDGTLFEKFLTDVQYPKARRMFARENDMIYAEDQGNGVAIKSFNGSSITELTKIESVPGGTQWGTVQYNTTQYGAGSEQITSPFYAIDFEGRTLFSLKSTSATNYIYTHEGQDENGKESFSRISLLDVLGSNYASFGNFQKTIWIGDTDGRIRKLQDDYVDSGVLTSSNIDVNTPNLDKLWQDIELITTPLPENTSITIQFSGDSGSLFNATLQSGSGLTGSVSSKYDFKDATIPEIANALLSQRLTYKVIINGTPSKTPIIRDVNIRYFVQYDPKNRWKMTIPCLDNIELLDETESGNLGSEWIDLLETILAKKVIISFEDIDQTAYDVIVDKDRPFLKEHWIETETGNEQAQFTINLLEV